ncbi:hypothetical protein ACWNXI_07785 [Caldibacillus thermoamylovorans]
MKPYTSEPDRIEGGSGKDGAAALARYARRQQAHVLSREKRKKTVRFFSWLFFALAVAWGAGTLIWNGYGALKTAASREMAIRQLKNAIDDHDVAALRGMLRVTNEEVPINKKTLAPLFAYFDRHSEAYDELDKEFDRQRKGEHVYIKGLTSRPPVFAIHAFRDRYVFEPAFYFLHVRVDDPEVTLVVNGVTRKGEATKDPFVQKIGPCLPGLYEITVVDRNGKKKTVRVELFGGARVREIDLTK